MATITVQPNQSMTDVIIMSCGTLEAMNDFCVLNDVAVSEIPAVGTVYQVPVTDKVNKAVLDFLSQNGIVIGTLGGSLSGPLISDPGDEVLISDDESEVLLPDSEVPDGPSLS